MFCIPVYLYFSRWRIVNQTQIWNNLYTYAYDACTICMEFRDFGDIQYSFSPNTNSFLPKSISRSHQTEFDR